MFTCRTVPFLISILALILISIGALLAHRSTTSQKSTTLFPIVANGKYGYIDQTGRVVIKPRFDSAKRFSEGLARVKVENKWGFIDDTGKLIIQPQFELEQDDRDNDSSLDFHEGLAAVSLNKGSKWGYIDQTGKMIIAPKYGFVSRFSEDLAKVFAEHPVTLGEDSPQRSLDPVSHSSYIDKQGNVFGLPLVGGTFSEGLAVVSTGNGENRKFGYINRTGRIKIEPQYSIAEPFHEGLARVRPTDANEWGYINQTGKLVISLRSLSSEGGPGDFSEGLAAMQILTEHAEHVWGFIDKTGKWVIEPEFLVVGRFSEGVAGACKAESPAGSGKDGATCGYIDRSGKWIIKRPADGAPMSDFYQGLALVCGDDFCGYINKRGEYVWRSNHEPFDPRRLVGCTLWNEGDSDYARCLYY